MEKLSAVALACSIPLVFGALAGCKRAPAKNDAHAEANRTFAMVCARCHGPDGGGSSLTPSLAAPPRNFRDATFQKERSDADLARVISEGKNAMPAFANVYTPEQITALVQVIRGFDPDKRP